jgi:hypothetical protein
MMNLRLAVLSVHTCPLAPLGGWETGGMNVYVREVSRELASRGVQVDVFTRRQNTQTPDVVEFAPGARVIHLEAGPPRAIDKYEVIEYLPEFACGVQRFRMLKGRRYDLIHAHYWLSMRPARQFRALWQVPLVAQFHTLAPLKNRVAHDDAEREFRERLDLERAALADADRVIALSRTDRRQMVEHYGAEAEQIEVIPGGVDLSRFRPGSRRAARALLGLPDREAVLLFVGRIQRLKGIEVLLRGGRTGGARPPRRPAAGAHRRWAGRERATAWTGASRASSAARLGAPSRHREDCPIRWGGRPAEIATILSSGGCNGYAVLLRVVRASRGRIDGLWHTGRGEPGRRAALAGAG